ncbi:MAG TPA: hypothetical protein VHM29_05165 [Acidimicrobiia bacterium]|nr:hypothetical protein [Acidimicrobiia bacterium]
MIRLAAVVLFAVEVGAGFGSASASVVSMTEQSMIVDVRVEVETTADSVVAHFALPDEDTITLPMLERDDGAYGVTTEVKPANFIVMFEAIGDPGAESDQVSLTDLGVDLSSTSDTTTSTASEELSNGTQQWLWLGVALGAASLSALAFWVLGGRDEDIAADEPEDGPQTDHPEPAPPGEEPSHVP